jgi:hypothetical protein
MISLIFYLEAVQAPHKKRALRPLIAPGINADQ